MLDRVKLLKELRQQLESAEAGEKVAELARPLRDPVQYAREQLVDSGIVILNHKEHYFTDVFWTRSGALGIRHDMHKLNMVHVRLPEGKELVKRGFGYKESIAVHGEVVATGEAWLHFHDYKP